MARTIAQIQQSIIDAKNADATLGTQLTSASNAAIWLLWTYIVAVAQWALENLFDQHVSEVAATIATMKPHTLQWYVTMARAFQYGYALPDGSDAYATIDPTAQVVTYAAATEDTSTGRLRIKAAAGSAGSLAALSSPQLTAFTAYMNQVKDAGVRLNITSGNPDSLKLNLAVYYDPLVLDATGARLDGTATTPVQDAINAFLQGLPFNGLFVLPFLNQAINTVSGVVYSIVSLAQANYGATPYVTITTEYQPDAGYMEIVNPSTDLSITFTPHNAI